MIKTIEDLRSGGALPTGPCSAWPKSRNIAAPSMAQNFKPKIEHDTKVKPSIAAMAQGFLRTAGQAVTQGKVSEEIRNQRYEVCKTCPHFIEDSKRCSECGCFMEAKTWVAGDPKNLCPKNKWVK